MIEILMSTAIMSVAFYMLSGSMANITSAMKKTDYNSNINSIKNTFANMIVDRRAWDFTTTNNTASGFACLNAVTNATGSQCTPGTRPFTPYNSNGQLFSTGAGPTLRTYDPRNNATHGLTLDGRVCYTYRAPPQTPDPNGCYVRVDFTWTPRCRVGVPCFRPEVDVNMNFTFNMPNGNRALGPLAMNGFNRSIRVPGKSVPVRLVANAARRCPNGSVVVAVNPTTGALTCESGTHRIYNRPLNLCYWNDVLQPAATCNPGAS